MATDTPIAKGQFAHVLIKPGIGVVGLLIIRGIVENLPMIHDAGSILRGKITVLSAATMVLDALVLFILITFAMELRGYLRSRFPEIPGLATIMIDLIFLIGAGFAYVDFKPILRPWPSIKKAYIWIFLALAVVPLLQMLLLLYQNIDRMTTVFISKIMSRRRATQIT
jgi:hypothetical protein